MKRFTVYIVALLVLPSVFVLSCNESQRAESGRDALGVAGPSKAITAEPRPTTAVKVILSLVDDEPCAQIYGWHNGHSIDDSFFLLFEGGEGTKKWCLSPQICHVPILSDSVIARYKHKAQAALDKHVKFCDE